MNAIKRRVNPWVVAVVMGVVAILFSVYGFQQQEELLEARIEIVQLKIELAEAVSNAEKNAEMARRNAAEAIEQKMLVKAALRLADENLKKINKRK